MAPVVTRQAAPASGTRQCRCGLDYLMIELSSLLNSLLLFRLSSCAVCDFTESLSSLYVLRNVHPRAHFLVLRLSTLLFSRPSKFVLE